MLKHSGEAKRLGGRQPPLSGKGGWVSSGVNWRGGGVGCEAGEGSGVAVSVASGHQIRSLPIYIINLKGFSPPV